VVQWSLASTWQWLGNIPEHPTTGGEGLSHGQQQQTARASKIKSKVGKHLEKEEK
jgi:hypothetical protein